MGLPGADEPVAALEGYNESRRGAQLKKYATSINSRTFKVMNHEEHEEHKDFELVDCGDSLIKAVLQAGIAVHRCFGPGLLESLYEEALAIELHLAGYLAERQVKIPVFYRGRPLARGFRADLLIERQLIVEVKAVERFHPIHVAQMITYQRLLGVKRGLLLNFNTRLLKEGIKKVSI